MRSKRNPSDDPTRGREVRTQEREEAVWLRKLKEGDPEELQFFLRERNLHPSQTRGVPEEQELWADPPADVRSGIQIRRQRRHDDRGRRRASVVEKISDSEEGRVQGMQSTEAAGSEAFGAEAERPQRTQGTEVADSRSTAGAAVGVQSSQFDAPKATKEKEKCRPRGVRGDKGQQKLKEEVVQELKKFDKSQFVFNTDFKDLESALRSGPGILDLFSGSRGLTRACCRAAPTWSLTFDIDHSPQGKGLKRSNLIKLILCGSTSGDFGIKLRRCVLTNADGL